VSPTARAKLLTQALSGDGASSEGKPVALIDCLQLSAGGNRLAMVDAYWIAWKRSAQYKNHAAEADYLNKLSTLVLEHRNQPTGPTEMLRVQAALMAAKAAMRDAQVAEIEAQYALALRIGAVADTAWPRPITMPHSNRYQLGLESLPRRVAESLPMRRLAATIPAAGESLWQRAEAVAAAEDARTAALEQYRTGQATIDQVLDLVASQTEQTSAFLDSLIDYNQTIAEYVVAAYPASASAEQLAESMVLKQQ
jgi:hypothetical protein